MIWVVYHLFTDDNRVTLRNKVAELYYGPTLTRLYTRNALDQHFSQVQPPNEQSFEGDIQPLLATLIGECVRP